MDKFVDLKPKEIFPDLPDARRDSGIISSKQIGYVYVLAKQNCIPVEDLEQVEFRHFNTKEATQFIDDLKAGLFYAKYIKKEEPSIFTHENLPHIDDSEIPFF